MWTKQGQIGRYAQARVEAEERCVRVTNPSPVAGLFVCRFCTGTIGVNVDGGWWMVDGDE